MKKILAILLALAMIFSLAACGSNGTAAQDPAAGNETAAPGNDTAPEDTTPAFDAEAVIAGFTAAPVKFTATMTQTYVLDVQNPDYQSFAKDVADEVVVNVDLTAGDVYYYGKLTEKDGSVSEQLVCKEGDGYVIMTTSSVKQPLPGEEVAVQVINDLMKALSLKTAGYMNMGMFTFNNTSWITDYVLLGSANVNPDDAYFAYEYADNNGGLKMVLNADYIGYFGDQGTFEFGKQEEAEHAGVVTVETTPEGFVTLFNEELTAYQALAIINPPVPLVLNGTRTMTASYDADFTRVESIDQDDMIVLNVENATVATFDFDVATMAATPGTDLTAGHFVAVTVEPKAGYVVKSVTVNGMDTQLMGTFYCLMTPAEDGVTYVIAVEVAEEGEVSTEAAVIVLGETAGYEVTTYDFDYGTMSFTEGTEVAPGHFVAFQINADEGTVNPTVNGEAVTFINGYYCYMSAAEAGQTYTIEVAAN